jgi:signal transduction histidine kinase
VVEFRNFSLGNNLKQNLNKIFLAHSLVILFSSIVLYLTIDYIATEEESCHEVIILFFALLSSIHFLVSYKLSQDLKRDIFKINKFLSKVKMKNSPQIELSFSKEFVYIGERLVTVIEKLHKTNKKKRKYNAQLKVANYQQERLLGAISHELKNPMSSIIGYAQILKDELESEFHIRFLEKIISNGKRSDELLNRLRLAIQLENNKFQLKYSIFNLKDIVEKAIENMRVNWIDRRVVKNLENCEIYADKTLIELVVINLIENGMKYSDSEIVIKLNSDEFSVEDFGIGIEEDDIANVTKRFYRGNLKPHHQSMGLGLAIVSYVLKLHQLKLEIKSEVGKGSIFSINIIPIRHKNLPDGIEVFEN